MSVKRNDDGSLWVRVGGLGRTIPAVVSDDLERTAPTWFKDPSVFYAAGVREPESSARGDRVTELSERAYTAGDRDPGVIANDIRFELGIPDDPQSLESNRVYKKVCNYLEWRERKRKRDERERKRKRDEEGESA